MTLIDTDPRQPTRVILEQGGTWGRWGTRIAWTVAGFSLLAALGSIGAFSQYFLAGRQGGGEVPLAVEDGVGQGGDREPHRRDHGG